VYKHHFFQQKQQDLVGQMEHLVIFDWDVHCTTSYILAPCRLFGLKVGDADVLHQSVWLCSDLLLVLCYILIDWQRFVHI